MSDVVEAQRGHNRWRFFWRDVLLRPLGFSLIAHPRVEGMEYVPCSGPLLVIYNHINFFDPVILAGVIHKRYVVPISKVENLNLPVLGLIVQSWGVIAVDRQRIDRNALMQTIDLLNAGYCVMVAPEGTRQPALTEVHEGFTYVALKTGATIVPAGIDRTPLIGRNLKRLRRTGVDVKFGPAFRFKVEPGERPTREQKYQMTTEAMYQLAQLLPEDRRGFYSDLNNLSTDTLEFTEHSENY